MASARKDKKGRTLYKGENEHAAGGYYYQYIDSSGRLVEAGVNIKVVQNVLGHADFTTTMDIYTDVTKDLRQREFDDLQKKLDAEKRRSLKKSDTAEEMDVSE